MGLRGIQPYIASEPSSDKRLSALIARALCRGIILRKSCEYVYTLYAKLPGSPVLLETMDIDAAEAAINSQVFKDIRFWDSGRVREAIAAMRRDKEAKREAEKAEQGNVEDLILLIISVAALASPLWLQFFLPV